jgi:hypothetical protein
MARGSFRPFLYSVLGSHNQPVRDVKGGKTIFMNILMKIEHDTLLSRSLSLSLCLGPKGSTLSTNEVEGNEVMKKIEDKITQQLFYLF